MAASGNQQFHGLAAGACRTGTLPDTTTACATARLAGSLAMAVLDVPAGVDGGFFVVRLGGTGGLSHPNVSWEAAVVMKCTVQ